MLTVRGAALMSREAPFVPINIPKIPVGIQRSFPGTEISPRGAGAPPEEHFTHRSKRFSPGKSHFFGSAAFQRNRLIFHAHRKAEENRGIIKLQ